MNTPSLQFMTCVCQNCPGHIEFEATHSGESITCPHCGLETKLYVPQDALTEPPAPTSRVAPRPIAPRASVPPADAEPSTTSQPKSDAAGKQPKLASLLTAIQLVAWILCFGVLAVGGVYFVIGVAGANGAPQEAAVGALVSTVFIGAYVFARLIEKICNLIARR